MDCKLIAVSSLTYAVKAKNKLENYNVYSTIEKIKNIPALNGCGYGVKVFDTEFRKAIRILNNEGIKIIDISDCGGKK